MKIMVFIPARGGSKGVPGKNKKVLGDKPLIAWTLEDALASTLVDRVIVSSEDDQIIDIALRWGAEVIRRPACLAQDTSDLQDAVDHALNWLKKHTYEPDYMVAMFPTYPFRREGLIDLAVQTALLDTDLCYVHALKPVGFDPMDLVMPDGKPYKDIERIGNDQIYSFSMNFGVQRMTSGPSVRTGIELFPEETIDIDWPEDWAMAERVCDRWK